MDLRPTALPNLASTYRLRLLLAFQRQDHLRGEAHSIPLKSPRMRRHSRPCAFNPSLITQHVNEDTAVGRASPDLSFLPITALDLTLHGLDGVSGEQICQWEQHVARRIDHDGRLSKARSKNLRIHKRPACVVPIV